MDGFRRFVPPVLVTLMAVACASPTSPDPRIPPAGTPPQQMLMHPCAYDDHIARCSVFAIWDDKSRTTRHITTEALWSSAAPQVVRVVSPGVLQAISPGEAQIDVLFSGARLPTRFRVLSVGPPWRVSTNAEYYIRVIDQNEHPLEGVSVEIIAGGNAGIHAVSNPSGDAIFRGDIACGPITVRGTKAGYRDWVGSATRCGRAGNGNWGSETVGPVRMVTLL